MNHAQQLSEATAATNDELMSTREFLSLAKINRNTAYLWRVKGIGPAFVRSHKGSRAPVRYLRADVTRFLEERAVMTVDEPQPHRCEYVDMARQYANQGEELRQENAKLRELLRSTQMGLLAFMLPSLDSVTRNQVSERIRELSHGRD